MEETSESLPVNMESVGMKFLAEKEKLTVLKDINLSINSGEFVCIIGPSGCGKTTLLRLTAGLFQRQNNNVEISGNIRVYGYEPDYARQRKKITFVMQSAALLPWLSVRGNLAFPLESFSLNQKERDDSINEVLMLVGLQKFRNFRPAELSAGMAHRVALARALLLNPPLWLFDEPFSHLDEINRLQLQEEVLKIWSTTRCTSLWVTHSVEEAVFLADRVIVMSSQPGTINDIIDINIERPRQNRTLNQADYSECIIRVREALWEASKINLE